MLINPKLVNSTEITSFFQELNDFCQEQKYKKLVFLDETEICNVSFSETYRAILDFDFSNRVIRNLFISHLESIQRYSPAAVSFIPFLIKEMLEKNVDLDHDNFLKITLEPQISEIHELLDSLFSYSSMLTSNDCQRIFDANGFISNFSIKKSNSSQNACIFNNGFFISGLIPEIFMKNSGTNKFEILECNIIIYDGYIQNVSEINLILNLSYEKKEKFVILSRGYSQDVQHTCAVNLSLNKTNVILFNPALEFWENQVETLVSSLNVNVCGHITGTLLNNFKLEEQNRICVNVNPQGIFIKDKSISLNQTADTCFYINEHCWKKRGILEDQLSFFSTLLQQIATCGIIKSEDFYQETNINLSEATGLDSKIFPSFPIFRALSEANKIKNKILNVGYLIECET